MASAISRVGGTVVSTGPSAPRVALARRPCYNVRAGVAGSREQPGGTVESIVREKSAFGHVTQVALCAVGLHVSPPRRPSHGPIVADCRRCGKTCYFHGLSTAGLGGPPMLVPLVVRELPAHSSR